MRFPYSASRRPSALHSTRRLGRRQFLGLAFVGLLLGLGFRTLDGAFRTPKAVLVLGGATEREIFAAEFAKEHPHLEIWVSSGSNPEYAEWVFSQAGIAADRLHLDYQAVDTVTNFTTLVEKFQARQIDSLYLITSDYHMRRASVIGEIVFGSRGIVFRTITVPSQPTRESEPLDKVARDAVRSLLWVMTGRTGANLASFLGR